MYSSSATERKELGGRYAHTVKGSFGLMSTLYEYYVLCPRRSGHGQPLMSGNEGPRVDGLAATYVGGETVD